MSNPTGRQLRAARLMLKLDQAGFAAIANLSVNTIKRLEKASGPITASKSTMRALVDVFDRLEVKFDVKPNREGVWWPASRNEVSRQERVDG